MQKLLSPFKCEMSGYLVKPVKVILIRLLVECSTGMRTQHIASGHVRKFEF